MSKPERLIKAFITAEYLTPDTINLKEKINISQNNKKYSHKFAQTEKVSPEKLLWVQDKHKDIKDFEKMRYKVYLGIFRINKMVNELRRLYKNDLPIINENYDWTYTASIGVDNKGNYIEDSLFVQQASSFMKYLNEGEGFGELYKKFRLLEQELKECSYRIFADGVTTSKIIEFQEELQFKANTGPLNFSNEICIKRIHPNSTDDIKFNSFYVSDLETVYKEIQDGHRGPVYTYLNGLDIKARKDIDQDFTLQQKLLNIKNLPIGRWPTENKLRLSTMQQIAVNILNSNESKETIRSINGPPGTGKTTLLKEVFANIVIERAIKMANFKNPKEGFKYERKIDSGGYKYNFFRLNENLKGYSMVVASSNNNAVENISRDLPKISEVMRDGNHENKEYNHLVENIDYYREIASLIVNNETDIKNVNNEAAWGLFSVPLGKGANIDQFFNQLLNNQNKANIINKMNEEVLDWKQTVDEFLEIIDKVNNQRKLVESLIHKSQELVELEKKMTVLKQKSQQLEDEIFHKQLDAIVLDTEHLKLKIEEEEMQNRKNEIEIKIRQIQDKRKEFDELLKQKAPSLSLPDEDYWESENNHKRQCTTPYLEDSLNHLRALCFLNAMKVHKAFHQHNKDIIKNHLRLLSFRKQLNLNTDDADILPDLWETLHLIVPVVSTTFSSLSSMYEGMKEGDIGYLFIDEAGQAVPQAAVGGIWRARQTFVVGDPIQIEPVVTLDDTIVRDIQKSYQVESDYFSSETSVQRLADLANPYGTYKGTSNEEWIGIPLWVHRRCINPMFRIANKIAYDNKMVLPEDMNKVYQPEDSLGGSKWVSIKGYTGNNKQFVKQQAEYVIDYVKKFFEEEENLKNKNKDYEERTIYVISPFSEIVRHLKVMFKITGLSMHSYSLKAEEWIKKCIGTVHTFQGKEAHTVLFVCGTDKDTEGARKWISQKPNLLNVAVTRAKKRFVLIADEDLFKYEEYFKEFNSELIIEHSTSNIESHDESHFHIDVDESDNNSITNNLDEDFDEYKFEENVEIILKDMSEYFFDPMTEKYLQIKKEKINEYSIYINIDDYNVKLLWRDDKSDPIKITVDEITKDFIRLRNILNRIDIKEFPEFIIKEVMYDYKYGWKNIDLKFTDKNNLVDNSLIKKFENSFFEIADLYSDYYSHSTLFKFIY